MVFDLTHPLENGMPVYPGTPEAAFSPVCTLERDGFRETSLSMTSHTGTHMDAPAHMLDCGATLDELPVSFFCGKALAADCSPLRGAPIPESFLRPLDALLRRADFLLLRTGAEARWGTPAYCDPFSVLSEDALTYLIGLGLRGIGTDAISVDPMDSSDFPNHLRLFRSGMVSMENLRLSALPCGRLLTFYALPLYLKAADGAPIRAIAVTPESEKEVESP